jgi:hypothetical protein
VVDWEWARPRADALRSEIEAVLPYWPVSGYATARAKYVLRVLETKRVSPAMLVRYTKELSELGLPIAPITEWPE